MDSSGFTTRLADHCYYVKNFDKNLIILLFYIDDILILDPDMQERNNLKWKFSNHFAMKDLGTMK